MKPLRKLLPLAVLLVVGLACDKLPTAKASVTVITVQATCTYADAQGNPYTAKSNIVSVSRTTRPDLTLDMTTTQTNGVVTFSLTLKNVGTETASGIKLVSDSPLAMTLPAVADIPVGQSKTVTWSVTL